MSRFPRRDWIYATSAQLRYIRLLNNQCMGDGLYIRDWDRILRSEVDGIIRTLKERIATRKERLDQALAARVSKGTP